ncbi:Phosphoadenosine phosphosulfate reductase [Sodalis praecaptivus]
MSDWDLGELTALDKTQQTAALAAVNQQLESQTVEQRVAWALEHLPEQAVLSSSFGIQAAVSLHLVTRQRPDIPVILTDTGYLFPETYRFIDELTETLGLNLQIFRANTSPPGRRRATVSCGSRASRVLNAITNSTK